MASSRQTSKRFSSCYKLTRRWRQNSVFPIVVQWKIWGSVYFRVFLGLYSYNTLNYFLSFNLHFFWAKELKGKLISFHTDFIQNFWRTNSGDLHTWLIQYSNGEPLLGIQMVHYSSHNLKNGCFAEVFCTSLNSNIL